MRKRCRLGLLTCLAIYGSNAPPVPIPCCPNRRRLPFRSRRRPVDRPPADLQHHDLPRRRQGPQQVVEGFGRKPEGSRKIVPRYARAGPRNKHGQDPGGGGFPGAVPQPFAEGGWHGVCRRRLERDGLDEACEALGELSPGRPERQAAFVVLPKGWLTVEATKKLLLPDTSWMDEPWSKEKFTAWMR